MFSSVQYQRGPGHGAGRTFQEGMQKEDTTMHWSLSPNPVPALV
jgi:hypothetical protein